MRKFSLEEQAGVITTKPTWAANACRQDELSSSEAGPMRSAGAKFGPIHNLTWESILPV